MPRRRLLVVDDEQFIREVAQTSLEVTAGWEVQTAASGSEGIEVAAATQPDAVLLDVMMPDMDGPSTVAELRSSEGTRHIPVIMLTAKAQTAERSRFASLDGVAGVIPKPFDPMTLATQVAQLLGWER